MRDPLGAATEEAIATGFGEWLNGAGRFAGHVPWQLGFALMPDASYPGGSKQRVNRAGEAVRNGTATEADLAVIDVWRAAHRNVINTFQAILRNRTRNTDIVVAQRHKRRKTIFDKLQRYEGMRLSRMDDVAGCRLIFKNIQ